MSTNQDISLADAIRGYFADSTPISGDERGLTVDVDMLSPEVNSLAVGISGEKTLVSDLGGSKVKAADFVLRLRGARGCLSLDTNGNNDAQSLLDSVLRYVEGGRVRPSVDLGNGRVPLRIDVCGAVTVSDSADDTVCYSLPMRIIYKS